MGKIKSLMASPVLRSVVGVGGAAAMSQAIMLLTSPLLTRILPQEAFGTFGLLNGLANILAVIALLGLSETIIAPADEEDARNIFGAGVLAVAAMSLPLALFTYLLIERDWFGYGVLPLSSIGVAMAMILVICPTLLFQIWMVRTRRFADMARSYLVLGAARAASQVGLGLAGFGWLSLALGDLLGRIFSLLWMVRSVRSDLPTLLRRPLASVRDTFWRFRRFPLSRTPAALANNVGTALPPILVSAAFDLHTTGLFTLMMTVLAAPVGLLQKAVGDVFLGHFASRYAQSPADARTLMFRTAALLFPCAALAGLVLFLFAPALFGLVFGQAWTRAGTFASMMSAAFAMELIVAPLGGVFFVTHRPELKVYVDVLRVTGLIASYGITQYLGLAPEGMAMLFGLLGFVSYAIYAALVVYSVYRPNKIH